MEEAGLTTTNLRPHFGTLNPVRRASMRLTSQLSVIYWSHDAAEHYADIRADLKKKGQFIGSNDVMIAAHTRRLGAIVVTNNKNDFRRA